MVRIRVNQHTTALSNRSGTLIVNINPSPLPNSVVTARLNCGE